MIEILAFDRLQREKESGILVHPRITDILMPHDLKTFKKALTILTNIEKFLKHGHIQGFSEAARARDEGNLRRGLRQQFNQKACLINIVASEITNLAKRVSAYEDVGSWHGISPWGIFYYPRKDTRCQR